MGRNNAITITASERITTIVQSLKNFARLDEAELQQADVREGIDSTLTLLHHVMKGRVEVIKEYGEVAPILCYPNQLNQVFMNLLANAAEAIEGNGTITISTAQVGTEIQVKIADSGGGIPAEIRERIFDPGITTKGRGVGTGLGLSISYNIVHDHQGRFEVQSKEGVGSEFTIVLPVEMKT
jgi:two-component system NtrC family sensor kinase